MDLKPEQVEGTSKKSPFDNLSRDELVKKCKGLLGIAQKAKQSKDELTDENKKLKEDIQIFDTQKLADKDCLKAMQEIVDSLTENKLSSATKINDLQSKLIKLENKLESANEEKTTLSNLMIENESLKRQIKRINDENDELLNDYSNLEKKMEEVNKMCIEQQQNLLLLEESSLEKKEYDTDKYKVNITDLESSNIKLSEEINKLNANINIHVQQIENLDKKNNDYLLRQQEFENEINNLNKLLNEKNEELKSIKIIQTNIVEENKLKILEFEEKTKNLLYGMDKITNELNNKINEVDLLKKSQPEESKLEQELIASKINVENVSLQYESVKKELEEITTKYENIEKEIQKVREINTSLLDTKHKKEKLEEKLKLYKTKIIEFSQNLKQLKLSRKLLVEIVKDYSQTIPKWQNEISKISGKVFEKVVFYEKENKKLQEIIVDLEKKQKSLNLNVDLEYEISELKLEIKSYMEIIEKLEINIEQMSEEIKSNLQVIDGQTEDLQRYKEFEDKFNQTSIENEKLLMEIDDKSQILEKLRSDIEIMEVEMKNLNECVLENSKTNESIELKIEDTKDLQINALKDEIIELVTTYDEEKNILNRELEDYNERCNFLISDRDKKETEIITLRSSIENILKKIDVITEENLQYKLKNETEIFNNKNDLENNQKMLSSLKTQLDEKIRDIEILEKNVNLQKTENCDLLCEMKEINQILKERGGVISIQQSKLSEYECKINDIENSMTELQLQLDQKDVIISNKDKHLDEINKKFNDIQNDVIQMKKLSDDKDKTIKELTDENQIREKMNISIDNQSEILSTSTISRADESSRMREIEDSFEDKYNKLRVLAVKLKKKVTDQNLQLAKYENENKRNDEKDDSNMRIGVQVKGLQNLQLQNDKLLDEIDLLKFENKKLEKTITDININYEKLKAELLDTKLTNDKSSNDTDKKEKQFIENTIKEYQNDIQNLKKENDSNTLTRKERDNEIIKLKNILDVKEKEFKEQLEKEKTLKVELEKSKATAKKSNVLSLEMDAYEKSLNDITQKLDGKILLIKELEITIDSQNNSIKSMNEQIKLLEDNLESENYHSKELKEQIDIHQKKLKESEHEKSELTIKLDILSRDYENVKLEMDDSKIQFTQSVGDKEKLCNNLQQEKDKLIRQVYSLEDEIETLKIKLKSKETEVDDLQTEFTGYKIRAQSVLRQNQTRDSSHENELEEEIRTLQTTIETLNNKIKTSVTEFEQLNKMFNELKDDKELVHKRYKDLMQLLEETRIHNETIIDDAKKQNKEHQDLMKSQRLHIDTLNNCYKKQIEEMEEKFMKEIENLKQKLGGSQKDKEILNKTIKEEKLRKTSFGPITTDEQKINMILLEREECEGSESNASQIGTYQPQRKISRNYVMPLEELLNTPFEENIIEERPVSPSLDLKSAKESLIVQESRVKHLTALLAEAEQDLGRLTQLNDVLKEEVRKQQRDLDREKHIHNSEYIKNVILKFLTLNSGDEKLHLVPVLNTVLKLSPEETKKLQSVAKGGEGSKWLGKIPIWSNNN